MNQLASGSGGDWVFQASVWLFLMDQQADQQEVVVVND